MKKHLIAIFLLSFATGCCGPANWAEKFSSEVECNMSVEEVQTLTKRPIKTMEPPRKWTTHYITDDLTGTNLWLGFEKNKLKYGKVLWAQKAMKMAAY